MSFHCCKIDCGKMVAIVNMPPPAYRPETESITVAVFYGGELRNMPFAVCIGGKFQKFDYVNVTHMNSDEDILEQALDHMQTREFTIYIEHTPPEPNEVAVETSPVRGKRGGGNDMNAETGGQEDDETGGNDMNDENDIGNDMNDENDAKEDNSENESVDMVASENDLDEHRQSDDEENGPNFVAFNPDQMYDPALELGMIFSSKKEFKKAVQSHAIKNKRTVKFTKNDSFRVYAVYSGEGCEWKIHATKLKNEQTFQVNLYKDEHTCPQVFKVKNVKTSWLSERYLQDFKSDPKRCVKGWRVDIMNELRCHVSRDQAYRAKREALKKLEGSPEYQFTKLWDYAEELRKTNPGSTVILGINDENGQNRFEKPVICVDGCHLKGPHKGILLIAVGRESTDTWEWFLMVLKQDVCIQRDSEYTFMFCVRHLRNNFKNAGFRGLVYKNAMWKAARASTVGKHYVYEDPNRVTMSASDSGVNDQPPMLPPIVEQHEPMQHDVELEILTEPGPTPSTMCSRAYNVRTIADSQHKHVIPTPSDIAT
ncbi:UNVERIFIED_CONTAM: hypothetical protein Sindi_2038500 [Sesamum indicum]